MPTESVRILVETNAAQIREEILGLGSSIASLGPSVDASLPELEEARAALESLEDATDSYVETLSNGDIPTKLESIGSAAGKATAAIGAFAGGLKIGQKIGELAFDTERWANALDLAKGRANELAVEWKRLNEQRLAFAIEDAGGDQAELEKILNNKLNEISRKSAELKSLEQEVTRKKTAEDRRSDTIARIEGLPTMRERAKEAADAARDELAALNAQANVLRNMTSVRAKDKQAAQEKLEAEKKASALIREQVKFQQKRDADFAKSFLFGDDFDQSAISDGERKAEAAFKERQRESERQRKEGIRDRIQSFRDELSELKKVGGAAALQGRDDRLGSGRANPLDAIAAADAKAAAERKAQLETLIKGQEALLKAQNTGPTINVNGP